MLRVSRSGDYAWPTRRPSQHSIDDQRLAIVVAETHKGSRCRYGSPRVHRELLAHGYAIARKRVPRLMGEQDKVWVTGITYIWARQRRLYLAAILDLSRVASRGGLGDRRTIDTTLCVRALQMVLKAWRPELLILHSDRGTRFSSREVLSAARTAWNHPKHASEGDCWDNAVAESCWG